MATLTKERFATLCRADLVAERDALAKDVNSTHTLPALDCVLSNDDYHEGEIIDMGKRLFRSVETLAHLAGEDAREAVDWLCDNSGMFKLYEKYFSPADLTPPAAAVSEPLTEEEILEIEEMQCHAYGTNITSSTLSVVRFVRAIEAAIRSK